MPASPVARLAGLCALILTAPALAADFDRPYPPDPGPRYGGPAVREPVEAYDPPPPPAPRGPRFTAAPPEACRAFVRRRFGPDGEPVLRRVQICDEPADRPDLGPDFGPNLRPDFGRGPPPPLPPEEVPPRRWGGPRW